MNVLSGSDGGAQIIVDGHSWSPARGRQRRAGCGRLRTAADGLRTGCGRAADGLRKGRDAATWSLFMPPAVAPGTTFRNRRMLLCVQENHPVAAYGDDPRRARL
ncbi:hypothetical protein [Saccharopolyspora sp. ASAGF58]|uniref:hypothetical protein n=1 Tax=Saccharopolyspora sp. ASAGF58 TaxID=2719023 RepID=UPI001440316D|nr:hypothetical protein [Saccharopolyspora sp. ASAGF58]QIZ33535.1 hypothetical protein FDZ84_00740 [Saccharopolyspora sp. ASAGF58]